MVKVLLVSLNCSQVVPPPTQEGSKSETKRAALLLDKIMFAVQKVNIIATTTSVF